MPTIFYIEVGIIALLAVIFVGAWAYNSFLRMKLRARAQSKDVDHV